MKSLETLKTLVDLLCETYTDEKYATYDPEVVQITRDALKDEIKSKLAEIK